MPNDQREREMSALEQMKNAHLKRAAEQQTVRTDHVQKIPFDRIVRDERIQVRVGGLNPRKVEQYAAIMAENETFAPFPAIDVCREGDVFWLADGWHRLAAVELYNLDAPEDKRIAEVPINSHPGGFDEAFRLAETANLEHGFNLTGEDKMMIFFRRADRGDYHAETTNREIARQLGVAHTTVGRWKTRYTKLVQKGLGANAPLAEEYARAKRSDRAKKRTRGTTDLHYKQRVVRDLRAVGKSFRALGEDELARQYEDKANDFVQLWKI